MNAFKSEQKLAYPGLEISRLGSVAELTQNGSNTNPNNGNTYNSDSGGQNNNNNGGGSGN